MSVSGVTTICLMQCNTSLSHRVECGLCRPTPLQWQCEVAGYWQELEHVVAHTRPEQCRHQGKDPDPCVLKFLHLLERTKCFVFYYLLKYIYFSYFFY